MTDEELSLKIAEFLEPKRQWALTVDDWWYSRGGLWISRVYTADEAVRELNAKPRSMVNDPAMTVMLLDKLARQIKGNVGILKAPSGEVWVVYATSGEISTENGWYPSLGRAVAEAFAKANHL